LIVTGDDFGLSHSVNVAVLRAHRDGILTSASLMVEAVPCGTTEIYSHPSLSEDMSTHAVGLLEFQALVAPGIRAEISRQAIRLTCYREALRMVAGVR
jgi:predicted glycoside hydrolase/deacetylase ChbG (UPF0249 family)